MSATPIRRDWVAPYRSAIAAGVAAYALRSNTPAEDPLLIASIGLRESYMCRALTPPTPDGVGDLGHGRGMFQIDDRGPFKHLIPPPGVDWPVDVQAGAACEVIADARRVLQQFASRPNFLCAVLCAYNAGTIAVTQVMASGGNPNLITTGRDYGDDVLRVYAGIKDPTGGWQDAGAGRS